MPLIRFRPCPNIIPSGKKINNFAVGMKELEKELLYKINNIPPYYIMYQGRDKSVALKDSVLPPEYLKEYR